MKRMFYVMVTLMNLFIMLLNIIMREELMIHDALVMFQSLYFMRASLNIMPSLKGIKEKRLLGDNPTLLPTIFVCSHY